MKPMPDPNGRVVACHDCFRGTDSEGRPCKTCDGHVMHIHPDDVLYCGECENHVLEDGGCEMWPRCEYKLGHVEVELIIGEEPTASVEVEQVRASA